MPTFRLIDLVRDREILDVAQREASAWFDSAKPSTAAWWVSMNGDPENHATFDSDPLHHGGPHGHRNCPPIE